MSRLAEARRSRDRRLLAPRNVSSIERPLSQSDGTKRWPLVDRCGFAWLTRISPWRTCTPHNWEGARPVYAVIIMGRGSTVGKGKRERERESTIECRAWSRRPTSLSNRTRSESRRRGLLIKFETRLVRGRLCS